MQLVSLANFAIYWDSGAQFIDSTDQKEMTRILDDLVSVPLHLHQLLTFLLQTDSHNRKTSDQTPLPFIPRFWRIKGMPFPLILGTRLPMYSCGGKKK